MQLLVLLVAREDVHEADRVQPKRPRDQELEVVVLLVARQELEVEAEEELVLEDADLLVDVAREGQHPGKYLEACSDSRCYC